MLVPVMKVDLYELTNNHLWRTEFVFKQFGEMPAPYMNIEQDAQGMTERGWLDFTFQNYYALLNCGFRLRPTAGTASGVHPVPLDFGRVYVHLPDGFSYDAWMAGLDAGRSFVTTGPMLIVSANGQQAGTTLQIESGESARIRLQVWARSEYPLSRIEIVSLKGVLQAINACLRLDASLIPASVLYGVRRISDPINAPKSLFRRARRPVVLRA